MKKFTLKRIFTTAMLVAVGTIYGQDNYIELDALGTGSEGSTRVEDEADFNVDASGVLTTNGTVYDDWSIASTGTITLDGAKSKNFSIKMYGIAEVNDTPGVDFGAIVTPGGIDRANNGDLGIRQGEAYGIEYKQGYMFGADVTSFTTDVTLQITEIILGGLTAGEEATIVNREDTSKSLIATTIGKIDVSSLELYVTGGSANLKMVSVFASAAGSSIRVTGLGFKLVDSSTLSIAGLNSELSNSFIVGPNPTSGIVTLTNKLNALQNVKASLIDVNGRILEEKKSTSNSINFDTTSLSSGMYFVKINNGINTITKKIIKN